MDLLNSKYVIVEVIPTSIKKETGVLVQLSALKLDGIKLIDRFDYRINEDKVLLKDFIDMCSYDKESFTYLDSTDEILDNFSKWIDNLPILIIDNDYTRNYLQDISNTKESILDYLEIENNNEAIDNIIHKYHLEPSNYIVDLLYEAIIHEID
jgi:DNA polymerase III alpha subunit (gram-positive type)